MSWHRHIFALFFPPAGREDDPEFRGALRRILHLGLYVTGGLGMCAIAIYVLGQTYGAGLPLQWSHRPGPGPTAESVVVLDKIVLSLLCAGLIGAAALRCSLRAGRVLAALAVSVGASASLYGDVTQGEIAVGYVTLLYMLAAGTIPFRPVQTLGLGAALTFLAWGAGTYGPPLLRGEPPIGAATDPLRLGVVTLLLTGISALLYESRYRQHQARREAEKLHEQVSELEEAKSQFFANLSHELKSPLTLILGPVEDALDGRYGDLPEAFRERLGAMKDQARRLRGLVLQLLRLSELEEGRMVLDARPIELAPFLKRMASLFRSMADREGVDIRVETDEGPAGEEPVVWADPEALQQIVSNLLSNALAHTPDGGTVRLKASLEKEASTGEASVEKASVEKAFVEGAVDGEAVGETRFLGPVEISVRDTGPGLSDEMEETLFDRYAGTRPRAEAQPPAGEESNSERTASVSTGIGLALVKELAERHGGSVQVESERDFGTEVAVRLPGDPSAFPEEDLARESEDLAREDGRSGEKTMKGDKTMKKEKSAERQASAEESAGDGATGREAVEPEVRHALGASGELSAVETDPPARASTNESGGAFDEAPTVLIADDEAPVRNYLREILRPQYSTVLAEDGKKALERAKEARPDLLISDVAMPGLDGFELCEALRQDEELRAVPIILLTVQKGEESRMEGLRRGADAYLGKPFRPEELRQRAENLIEVRQYLQAGGPQPPGQDSGPEGSEAEESGAENGEPEESGEEQSAPEEGPPSAPLEEEEPLGTEHSESDFLQQARQSVEEHLGNSGFGVEWLAEEVGLSSRQLQRRLQDEAGLSAGAFIRAVRLGRAAELLESGEVQTVKEAAQATGYRDPSHFSRLFKEAHGRSPSAYKSQGSG